MAYADPHNEMSSGYVYNDAGLRQYATRGTGEYWHYQYDAMGQVVAAQKHLPNKAAIPGFGYGYAYDTIGNRLSAGRNGYGPTLDYEQRFVCNGWNMVARMDVTTLDPEQTYVWGTDLSGTPQGAGGVGGLLLITDHSSRTTNLYPQYDSNGNILAVVDAASGCCSETTPVILKAEGASRNDDGYFSVVGGIGVESTLSANVNVRY